MVQSRHFYKYSVLCFMTLLVACSGDDKKKAENPDILYNEAQNAYEKKDYEKASDLFKELETEFPYSKHTKDGLLKTAHAQFEEGEFEKSAETIKRYIDLYPGAANTDYALYLLSMSYYNRISDPRRDQNVVIDAKKYLQELIGRYPDSEYSVDAQIKLDFVVNQLAAKDMQIGRFYLRQEQVPAAINRFKNVVKNYQTTAHIQEALYRLTEGYLILGLQEPAYKAATLLGYNYPDSPWYHDAYKLMQKVDPNFKGTATKQEAEGFWDYFGG